MKSQNLGVELVGLVATCGLHGQNEIEPEAVDGRIVS